MSIYFDASGDLIKQTTSYSAVDIAACSLFFRLKWSSAPGVATILMKAYDSTGGNDVWQLDWSSASTRFSLSLNDALNVSYASTAGLTLTEWIDMAWAINGTSATWYVKQHSVSSWTTVAVTSVDFVPYNDGWLWIPSTTGGGLFNVCHTRMWTTTLTENELLAEAASATLVKQTNVLFNCPLPSSADLTDTAAGSYSPDNGYDWTAGGTPTTGDADPTFGGPLVLPTYAASFKQNTLLRM